MKVYKKKIRKILVGNHTFLYTIIEDDEFIILRCYSNKSSYLEVCLGWGRLTHDTNAYKPKVVSLFIEYALKKGWNYSSSNQIYKISANDVEAVLKELGIDLLSHL